jgi:hypothetical protein
MGFFSSLLSGARKILGRVLPVAKQVGSFIAKNHGTLASVGMGLANLSGNETAKKIAGVGAGLSGAISMRQNLDKQNAMAGLARAQVGNPNAIYNASTNKAY